MRKVHLTNARRTPSSGETLYGWQRNEMDVWFHEPMTIDHDGEVDVYSHDNAYIAEHGYVDAQCIRDAIAKEDLLAFVPVLAETSGRVAVTAGQEVRVVSETGGEKGKKLASVGSLDPRALLTLAEVSGWGAQKYEAHNYLKGYDWSLSFDACQRHLLAHWGGEELDAESGLPHLAHAAWHCLAMLAFMQRGLGTDDRPPR